MSLRRTSKDLNSSFFLPSALRQDLNKNQNFSRKIPLKNFLQKISSKKNSFKIILHKNSQKITKELQENSKQFLKNSMILKIQFPTSHLEAKNPFGLVCF